MKNHHRKTAALSWFTGIAASAVTVYAAKKLLTTCRGDRNFDLRGKVTLITGGSRGFGFALAQEFGNHGSRLALCARDDRELQEACRRLAEKGIEAAPFICDITKETEIPSLLTRVVERFGSIDILVNNAGFIKVGPLDSFEHADFERRHEPDVLGSGQPHIRGSASHEKTGRRAHRKYHVYRRARKRPSSAALQLREVRVGRFFFRY